MLLSSECEDVLRKQENAKEQRETKMVNKRASLKIKNPLGVNKCSSVALFCMVSS